MKRLDFYISLIAIMWLTVVVLGFISEDVIQRSDAMQSSTLAMFQPGITAEVEKDLVKLSHTGGGDITLSNITIIIEQGDASAIYEKLNQSNDKFVRGDTLHLTPAGISLNGRELKVGKISINSSGVVRNETTVMFVNLTSGNLLTKIVSDEEFFS
ncbi:hypothetical protein ANME2D_02667 [Candidatus Methanoperedens nitroreducens]|uniref:Archaeal Type IV pilin N-terminal domain-containing protein n=1 Tax=Candidatus Methanoperedens nitratireducens TaxID=1392998 RepID=A0A062V5G1_9EURY|nr:hypothetical protein [Candidatus Methanoperedens nitroreducens]KCZ70645.1 hypothetical protein ANME2D_02667 [Candidatus Methanoperedens nitroreducens]MDJ1420498.1 hypothetical protein [Candidatus Methanoperedens sp.]